MSESLSRIDGELRQNWYIVALAREVFSARPLRRLVYDTPYVVFRTRSGRIWVMRDQCLHRGAQLSLGKIEGEGLRCPYHGWMYDREGKVIDIPSDGPEEAAKPLAERRKWCSQQVPVCVRDGVVWIWAGDAALATPEPPWHFPECDNRRFRKYFMITDFDNEVTNLVQNFMDVPHTVFVHSNWFRNRSLLRVPVKIEVRDGHVKVTYDASEDSIGFTGRILNPGNEPMFHTDEFIFPNITRVDYGFGSRHFVINSQCTPVSRFKTRVYTWIAYDLGWAGLWLEPFMRFYTRRVIEQDVGIMKNQGDNLQAVPLAEAKSTQADELHLAVDRLRELGVHSGMESVKAISFQRNRELWI